MYRFNVIREKIKKREDLRKELEEGYKSTNKEDLNLTKDFESADLENWK